MKKMLRNRVGCGGQNGKKTQKIPAGWQFVVFHPRKANNIPN